MKSKVAVFIAVLMLALVSTACWAVFPTDWQYYKEVTITNSTSALTDYQVFVSTNQVNISNLISQGKMLVSLNDVRFADSDKNTLLNYWIDNSKGETSGFWVKVPNIPAQTTKNIYIYYGNSSATSASDGPATFDFFDNFNSYSNGSDGSPKWTTNVQWTVQNGVFAHQGNSNSSVLHYAKITDLNATDFAMECKWRWDGNTNEFLGFCFRNQNPSDYNYNYINSAGSWGSIYCIAKTTGNFWGGYENVYCSLPYTAQQGIWINTKTEAVGRKIKAIFGNTELSWTDSKTVWFSTGSASFIANYNASWSLDDVRIRKLIYPEPAAVAGQEFPGERLVGYWYFDEGSGTTATDSSGNGNDGTIHGATYVAGRSGQALQFDGVNDYVEILNEQNFDFEWNQPITIEAWINTASTANYQSIFSKQSGTIVPFPGYSLELVFRDSGYTEFNLHYEALNDYNIDNKRLCVFTDYDFVPHTNEWHHVAMVYDGSGQGGNIKFYIDSALNTLKLVPGYGNNYCTSSILNNLIPIIGARENGTVGFFNGLIDEVKVYNYARTAGQIAQDAGASIVSGKVTKSNDVSPISGALVEIYQNDSLIGQANTDSNGNYSIPATAGNYRVFASSRGYIASFNKNVVVNTGQTTTLNVSLNDGDNGLVGYWNFEEGIGTMAFDSSGNGNHGAIIGASWTTDTFGSTLRFDGVNDYVNVPDKSSLDLTTEMTAVAWVKTLGKQGNFFHTIIAKCPAGSASQLAYLFRNIFVPRLGFDSSYNGTAVEWNDDVDNVNLDVGTWYCLAVTFDVTDTTLKKARMYVNGVYQSNVGSAQASLIQQMTQLCTNNAPLTIGAGYSGTGEFMDGLIDELKIYNYARTAQQIAQDANVTAPVISYVNAVNIDQTAATIIWNTDKPATSQVEYGLTSSYGTLTSDDTSLIASHSINLVGLTPGTQFHYRVRSRDSLGNESVSGDYAFTTLQSGVTPPVIININIINITQISVTIVWNTDKPSTSQIEYGATINYTSITTIDTNLLTDHSVSLTGLTVGIEYHYRLRIKDSSGNEIISGDNTFTIPPSAETDNPPAVNITYPGNRQTIQGNLNVIAEASDDHGVAKVDFFVDGVKKNTNQVGPYHWIWDTTLEADGEHTLKAIAYDTIGQTATDEKIVAIHQKPNDVDIKGELKPVEPVVKPGQGRKARICYTVDMPADKKQTAGQNALVHVKITIHTLRGTLVKILVDQDMPLGAYQEYWDGTNFAQEVAASGVYIVKLQAGDFRDMKKIVVVK